MKKIFNYLLILFISPSLSGCVLVEREDEIYICDPIYPSNPNSRFIKKI